MRISSHFFEAFLKCPTKCHLRSVGETSSGNEYTEWVHVQEESYQREATRRLEKGVPETERVVAPPATENLKAAKWRLAVDAEIVAQASSPASSGSVSLPERTPGGTPGELADETSALRSPAETLPLAVERDTDRSADSHVRESPSNEETRGLGGPRSEQFLESRLHAVERVPSEGRGKPAQFVPIRFVFRNKLTKDDRLLLAFDALILSQLLGREVSLGKIIHVDDHATLKVRTSARTSTWRTKCGSASRKSPRCSPAQRRPTSS